MLEILTQESNTCTEKDGRVKKFKNFCSEGFKKDVGHKTRLSGPDCQMVAALMAFLNIPGGGRQNRENIELK